MSWIGLRLRKLVSNLMFGKKEIRIIMAGLDAAGKTTIIYKLKLRKLVTTKPSIGFEVETLEYNDIKFTVWELGGQSRYSIIATISSPKRKISDLLMKIFTIRSCRAEPLIWKHKYLFNTNGLIYVVDSIDKDRVAEASSYLHRIMNKHEYRDAVLLVFANKQDLPNAMTNAEITEKLDLNSLGQSKWYIQSACATSGDGLHQGLDWLCNNIDFTTKRMRSHQRHSR